MGKGVGVSEHVAKALDIVDQSGLKYQFTPMGTILEGGYEDVMHTIKECHEAVLEDCERVITTIKIDDRKGSEDAIGRKVQSVERRLGKDLQK